MRGLRRLLVLTLVVLGGSAVYLAAASASISAPTGGVTYQLVPSTKCSPPQVVLGTACADKSGLVVSDKWTVGASSAQWNVTGQWQVSYEWTVPQAIPLSGATMTMKMTGTELIGGANNRICPAMGATAGFDVGGPQPVSLGFCAEAGGTKGDSKTVKLVPSSASAVGTIAYVNVGLQDGPVYHYQYKAVAEAVPQTGTKPKPGQAKPKCRKPSAVGTPGNASGPAAACVVASITTSPCYRVFLGLDDPSPTDDPSGLWRTDMGVRVARTAIDYPGVTIEADIPGEESGGVHSPALLIPGNDLYALLALSQPPTQLFQTGNVYARVTPRFEVVLRQKILASRGNLMPADVLRLALDSVKQVSGTASYPLAVLTAHNLLKNATMIGRAAIQDANALHLPKNPSAQVVALYNSKVANEVQTLCKWSPIVAKLASLRLIPASSKDKMGPWYHGFGILSAGALLNGDEARLAMLGEHGGKVLKIFSNEGGFNREKFELDKEFAATAVHISKGSNLRRF